MSRDGVKTKKQKARRTPRQTEASKRLRARTRKQLDNALTELQRAELVRASIANDAEYLFKHALVQDTALSTLLRGEYKRLNLLVARAYEKIYTERELEEYAAQLAQHYDAAGDDAKTFDYATRAGDQAARVYANTEAITFYTQALEAAKRVNAPTAQLIHLYTKRGRVYEVMANLESLATYQEMGEYARARGDRALELQALLLRGTMYAVPQGPADRTIALELAAQANALAMELGNRRAQAHALWIQLLTHLYNSEIPDAIRVGESALALASEPDARELRGYILTDLARAFLQSGHMARVPALETEARAIWRELDNKPMLADNLMQTATQALLRGAFDETITLTDEGIEISETIGSKISHMSNQGVQLLALFECGDVTRVFQRAEGILRIAAQLEGGFPMQSANGAWVYATFGAISRGAELAAQARRELQEPLPEFFRAWAWVMLTRYYIASGDVPAARRALAASQMENHLTRVDPAGMFGAIALGETLLAEGAYALAADLMAERAQMLKRLDLHHTLSDILYVQAQAARALGNVAHAFELLERACAEAEAINARRVLWQIYAALSELETERGNSEQAHAYREQARAVLKFMIESAPQEFRAGFLNLPRVRAVMNGTPS